MKKTGKCRLCGKTRKLSFEHVTLNQFSFKIMKIYTINLVMFMEKGSKAFAELEVCIYVFPATTILVVGMQMIIKNSLKLGCMFSNPEYMPIDI